MNSNFILRHALNSIHYFSIAVYGNLNENGSYRPIGRGTIRRGSLVEVGVALLEKVCHWGWTLRFQMFNPGPMSYFLPAD